MNWALSNSVILRQEASNDIVDYIAMFYNPLRWRSYLEYQSPGQYECEAQW
jgi:hypothetical protein